MDIFAPEIVRQRLLIEGYYDITIKKEIIEDFLKKITKTLHLRTYGEPIIFSPTKDQGKIENQGYDVFIPLIDSGISIYFWTNSKFLSLIVYSCKNFDEKKLLM